MLKKILLAFDGSTHSLKAAQFAQELAKLEDASVEIVYVRENLEFKTPLAFAPHDESLLEAAENEILARAEAYFKDSGVSYSSKALHGDPAHLICTEAEEYGFTEIIIGSQGKSSYDRFLIGSVSNKVSLHSPCTVIIVK